MPIPHLLNPGALAESSLCWNLQQETLQTEKYDAYTSPHTFTLDALRGTNSFKAALFKIDSSSSPFETGTEANSALAAGPYNQMGFGFKGSSSKGTTAAQSAHKDTTAPRDTVEAITADKEETHAASSPATDSKRIRFGYKSKLMAFFKTIDTEDAGLAPRLDLRVGLQEKFPEETHPAVSPPKQRPKARIPLGRLMPSFASARSCRWPKHCITPTV